MTIQHFFMALIIWIITQCCSTEPVNTRHVETKKGMIEVKKDTIVKSFNNPVFMAGTPTDFLSYLAILKQVYGVDTLLTYTASGSLKRYPRKQVIELYERTNFHFKKKLKVLRRNSDTIILTYTGNIFSTTVLKSIKVKVEADTVRLCLPNNLNEFLK